MGYGGDIVLKDVRILKTNFERAKKILRDLNVKWTIDRDYCRFDTSLEDLLEIFDEIGYTQFDNGDCIVIDDFERENFGDSSMMFMKLAEVLENCVIEFYGEDQTDWTIKIKNYKVIVEKTPQELIDETLDFIKKSRELNPDLDEYLILLEDKLKGISD